jgi:hypothetical protein
MRFAKRRSGRRHRQLSAVDLALPALASLHLPHPRLIYAYLGAIIPGDMSAAEKENKEWSEFSATQLARQYSPEDAIYDARGKHNDAEENI